MSSRTRMSLHVDTEICRLCQFANLDLIKFAIIDKDLILD